MRLWSLHPALLDRAGLVAGWREGLLAQKVLQGLTKGYRHHPQLARFTAHVDPIGAIGYYLTGLVAEARSRGYNFDKSKIVSAGIRVPAIEVTRGQIEYEAALLRTKLAARSAQTLEQPVWKRQIAVHPSFVVIPGPIASWEKVQDGVLVSLADRQVRATPQSGIEVENE